MIKATYTLDPDTVRALEAMARRLGVSKSEALRRAIRAAADSAPSDRVAAFEEFQRAMALTPARAEAWAREVRAERYASTRPLAHEPLTAATRPKRVAEPTRKRSR